MSDFSAAYPNSKKVFVDGPQSVRVPMREILLEQGKSSIRMYDTSGPQGHDVKDGLPEMLLEDMKMQIPEPQPQTETATPPSAQ